MKIVNKIDLPYWEKNEYVLGIDEAGRGPLAGELVVVGVVFPLMYENDEINDSKKTTPKKRLELFQTIQQDALEVWIEIVDVATIDQENIYQATKHAMQKIALKSKLADVVLTDAMPLAIDKPTLAIVKGDQKSISIAAASIVAKVLRDQMMEAYDLKYPNYGFKSHKGYGTKKHIEAIHQYGVLPIHRTSYQPVKGIVENDSND